MAAAYHFAVAGGAGMRRTMIHRTTAERAERILQDGLRVGMPLNLTDCGTWAHVWYGTNPVFLAMPDAPFLDAVPDDGADIAARAGVFAT
jgi:hypothetical protein